MLRRAVPLLLFVSLIGLGPVALISLSQSASTAETAPPSSGPVQTPTLEPSPSTRATLRISSPADGATTSDPLALVSGLTQPGAEVARLLPSGVVARWKRADASGQWVMAIELEVGLNLLTFQVGDDRSTTQSVRVNYVPRVAAVPTVVPSQATATPTASPVPTATPTVTPKPTPTPEPDPLLKGIDVLDVIQVGERLGLYCLPDATSVSCNIEFEAGYFNYGAYYPDGTNAQEVNIAAISSRSLVRSFLRDAVRGLLGAWRGNDVMAWIADRESVTVAKKRFGPYIIQYKGPMSNGQVDIFPAD